MDVLNHVFVPLLVAYVVRPSLFSKPRYAMVGGFSLLPDFDKLIGVPGLLHSIVTLVPICLGLIALERAARGKVRYTGITSMFAASHLLRDIVDIVIVLLLFPLVTTGIGLAYPIEMVFGIGPLGY